MTKSEIIAAFPIGTHTENFGYTCRVVDYVGMEDDFSLIVCGSGFHNMVGQKWLANPAMCKQNAPILVHRDSLLEWD